MDKQWIGIDISKDHLSIASFDEGHWQEQEIDNSVAAIGAWVRKLDSDRVHVVLEFTGTYGHKLVWLLHRAGITLSAITPKQSRQFSGVMKNITKNDSRDARLLARFGQQMQPKPYTPPSEALDRMEQLRTLLRQLKRQRQMVANQQHALQQRLKVEELVSQITEQHLAHLEAHIQRVEQQINSLAEAEFSEMLKRVTSVKGIGKTIGTALLVATNGLSGFDSHKQLAKFIGIAPTQYNSGSSVKAKGGINRTGDAHLRSLMYNATWSALKSNKACKMLFDRLRTKGKPVKVALIAVAHKLIRQIWAVVKHNTLFDNNFEFKELST